MTVLREYRITATRMVTLGIACAVYAAAVAAWSTMDQFSKVWIVLAGPVVIWQIAVGVRGRIVITDRAITMRWYRTQCLPVKSIRSIGIRSGSAFGLSSLPVVTLLSGRVVRLTPLLFMGEGASITAYNIAELTHKPFEYAEPGAPEMTTRRS